MCDALIGHDKCAETCTAFSRSPCCLGRYSSCKKAEHVRLCNKARSISFDLGFWFQAYLSWNEHEDPEVNFRSLGSCVSWQPPKSWIVHDFGKRYMLMEYMLL